jgi:hypothetical protein
MIRSDEHCTLFLSEVTRSPPFFTNIEPLRCCDSELAAPGTIAAQMRTQQNKAGARKPRLFSWLVARIKIEPLTAYRLAGVSPLAKS